MRPASCNGHPRYGLPSCCTYEGGPRCFITYSTSEPPDQLVECLCLCFAFLTPSTHQLSGCRLNFFPHCTIFIQYWTIMCKWCFIQPLQLTRVVPVCVGVKLLRAPNGPTHWTLPRRGGQLRLQNGCLTRPKSARSTVPMGCPQRSRISWF